MSPSEPSAAPRGALPPGGGSDPPGTICRFGKRTLDRMSWLAPLVNNPIGDRLNLELRHEQLFFISGDRVVDDIGYSDRGTRFSEADFGKPIGSLEDLRREGYWLVGRTWPVEVMREALARQQDGSYYNFFSNQCQDWADRLKRTAERVERERGLVPLGAGPEEQETFTRYVPPTEPASVLMGLVSLVLGASAMVAPLLIANLFALVLGVVFVASGASHVAYALHGRDWRNLVGISLIGLLYVAGGGFWLLNRSSAMMAGSVVIALTLATQGALHVALGLRGRPPHRWAAALVAGFVMLGGAFLAWRRGPSGSDEFFGIVVGSCLLVGGLATLWLSWSTRREEDAPSIETSSL